LLLPRVASAEPEPDEAKRYFDAGAAAYTAGDYQAAVQALEAAYRKKPLPAIAFSLAQAERRQYFVSHDPANLERAIELYRAYLSQVPTGGRRADATDALGQLEPLALARKSELVPEIVERTEPVVQHTRLMVRCQAPRARIALDSGPFVPAPLITETAPGNHRVQADAPGFFPVEQQVVAVAGELVPIEVALRERPALVLVENRNGADVYVDGVLSTSAAGDETLSLRAGPHSVAFAKKGHRLRSFAIDLDAGETRKLAPNLEWTGQRIAAITLFAVSGTALAVGGVFTGLAVHHESTATDIEQKQGTTTITPAEREEHADAIEARDSARIAAVSGFALGVSAALSGLLLYEFDDPDPHDAPPRASAAVNLSPETGMYSVGLLVRGVL
jgi:tetratricopeptide (TPR) repeat protein